MGISLSHRERTCVRRSACILPKYDWLWCISLLESMLLIVPPVVLCYGLCLEEVKLVKFFTKTVVFYY